MTYAVVKIGDSGTTRDPIKGRDLSLEHAMNAARAYSADFWGWFSVVDGNTKEEICCYSDSRKYRGYWTAAGGQLQAWPKDKTQARLAEILG